MQWIAAVVGVMLCLICAAALWLIGGGLVWLQINTGWLVLGTAALYTYLVWVAYGQDQEI